MPQSVSAEYWLAMPDGLPSAFQFLLLRLARQVSRSKMLKQCFKARSILPPPPRLAQQQLCAAARPCKAWYADWREFRGEPAGCGLRYRHMRLFCHKPIWAPLFELKILRMSHNFAHSERARLLPGLFTAISGLSETVGGDGAEFEGLDEI